MRRSIVIALVAAVTALAAPVALAQQRINFDDLTTTGPGQGGQVTVSTRYAARGVTFNSPVAIDYSKGLAISGFAHSGTIAIEQCYSKEFCSTPIQIDFTAAQAVVKLWVGSSQRLSGDRVVQLSAFDASGLLIGTKQTVLPRSTTPVRINNPVAFEFRTPVIRRVRVSYALVTLYTNGLAIDDVEFSSVGPPPPCAATGAPVIQRVQPPSSQIVQANKFLLQGSVDGRGGAISDAVVAVTSGAGATRTLNVLGGLIKPAGGAYGSWIHDLLFPGTNTVRLTVTNCRGSSLSTVSATYQPINSTARFELLHVEVTQATQTMDNSVPLVSGKPTVVRAYLRVTGQSSPIGRVSGVLIARRDDGTPAPGPVSVAAMATSTVTASDDVAAKRLDLGQSLNFRLPDEWIKAGRLHVEIARLKIEGDQSTLPCDRCDNAASNGFPALVTFAASRRLNLVLAPYTFARPDPPRTPELATTIGSVLQWVNNAYPLAGDFPEDWAGINLIAILPLNSTTRDLAAADDETWDKERNKFLNELGKVYAAWRAANPGQPEDTRLLAIVPCECGGRAQISGKVGFADTNAVTASGPSDASFGRHGARWAHELGHTFGRRHAGADEEEDDVDEDFPDADGHISEPGLAITTEWWRGNLFVFDPDTVDIMGYGSPRWVSPYTYRALRTRFRATTQLTQPAPGETLLISGTISPDLLVTLDTALRATAMTSGTGAAGEFTVRLLDATGNALLSYRFDGITTSDDASGEQSFSEFVPWRAGTRRIVVGRDDVVLAARDVSQNPPSVTIVSPAAGDVAANTLDITWTGSDADNDALTYAVLVDIGNGVWQPVAAELQATSFTLDTGLLPATSEARVRVQASDGVNSAEAISGTFAIAHPRP